MTTCNPVSMSLKPCWHCTNSVLDPVWMVLVSMEHVFQGPRVIMLHRHLPPWWGSDPNGNSFSQVLNCTVGKCNVPWIGPNKPRTPIDPVPLSQKTTPAGLTFLHQRVLRLFEACTARAIPNDSRTSMKTMSKSPLQCYSMRLKPFLANKWKPESRLPLGISTWVGLGWVGLPCNCPARERQIQSLPRLLRCCIGSRRCTRWPIGIRMTSYRQRVPFICVLLAWWVFRWRTMPFLERIWWPQEGEREEQQEEKKRRLSVWCLVILSVAIL